MVGVFVALIMVVQTCKNDLSHLNYTYCPKYISRCRVVLTLCTERKAAISVILFGDFKIKTLELQLSVKNMEKLQESI